MKRALVCLCLLGSGVARADDAAVRRVLHEEMARARKTYGQGKLRAHHVACTLYDVERALAEAEQGAALSARARRYRALRVVVRVGDRTFDSGKFDSWRDRTWASAVSVDDDPEALRAELADAGRAAYRSALAALSSKREAGGTERRPEDGPLDFADAPPATIDAAGPSGGPVDLTALSRLTRGLSKIAAAANVQGEGLARARHLIVRRRLVTSEGTWVDERRGHLELRVSAGAQSTDGTRVRSEAVFTAVEPRGLPPQAELERAARELGAEAALVRDAPAIPSGKAVVLFEPLPAAALLRHMLAVSVSGTPPPFPAKGQRPHRGAPVLAAQLGKAVAPAFLDLFDDPRVELGPGKVPLFGHYAADEEGVPPARVTILERGKVVSLPSSRALRAGLSRPNGHARGGPHHGNYDGVLGNLFLASKAALPEAALRQRAMAAARAMGPETPVYIVRRVEVDDFDDETDGPIHFVEGTGWGGSYGVGGGRGAPPLTPLVTYRLVEGREEPVRGISFRGGLEARRLADVVAVGEEPAVANYFERPYLGGAGELVIPSSIVTPAVVLTNVDVERERPRHPRVLYPHPALAAPTCHTLPLTSQPVRERLLARPIPTPRGGVLADGIYDATADEYHVGPGGKEGPTSNLRRRTLRIQGNRIDFVINQLEPERGELLRTRGTFTASGTTLRIVTECPRLGADQISYWWLGDTLHLYYSDNGRNIDVYVRRR